MVAFRERRGFTLLELCVVIAIVSILIALTLCAVQQIRAAAQRATCAVHLQQIGVALQNYHDANAVFPPGVGIPFGSPDGYDYLGWQARLLPFLEEHSLWSLTQFAYQQDSNPLDNPPHVGLATPIALYVCPSEFRPVVSDASAAAFYDVHSLSFKNSQIGAAHYNLAIGLLAAHTNYLGVTGANLFSTTGMLFENSRVRLADVTDGTSSTLMVGERPQSPDPRYGWWYAGGGQFDTGSPDMVLGVQELNVFNPYGYFGCSAGPYEFTQGSIDNYCDVFHFWSLHPGGANFLFVDGSVRFLPYSIKLFAGLATRAAGEVIPIPD